MLKIRIIGYTSSLHKQLPKCFEFLLLTEDNPAHTILFRDLSSRITFLAVKLLCIQVISSSKKKNTPNILLSEKVPVTHPYMTQAAHSPDRKPAQLAGGLNKQGRLIRML